MDRGAWWATVHGAVKSRTRLRTHSPMLLESRVRNQRQKPYIFCTISHLGTLYYPKLKGTWTKCYAYGTCLKAIAWVSISHKSGTLKGAFKERQQIGLSF